MVKVCREVAIEVWAEISQPAFFAQFGTGRSMLRAKLLLSMWIEVIGEFPLGIHIE